MSDARLTASTSIGNAPAIASAVFGVELGELLRAGAKLFFAKTVQRHRYRVEVGVHVVGFFLDVEKPREHFALVVVMLDIRHRRSAIGRIVVLVQLGKLQEGAVMLL